MKFDGTVYRYAPRLRPPGFATLPPRWPWVWVEAPGFVYHAGRFREAFPGIPLCTSENHRFGIIGSEVQLTKEQLEDYEIDEVKP